MTAPYTCVSLQWCKHTLKTFSAQLLVETNPVMPFLISLVLYLQSPEYLSNVQNTIFSNCPSRIHLTAQVIAVYDLFQRIDSVTT